MRIVIVLFSKIVGQVAAFARVTQQHGVQVFASGIRPLDQRYDYFGTFGQCDRLIQRDLPVPDVSSMGHSRHLQVARTAQF